MAETNLFPCGNANRNIPIDCVKASVPVTGLTRWLPRVKVLAAKGDLVRFLELMVGGKKSRLSCFLISRLTLKCSRGQP